MRWHVREVGGHKRVHKDACRYAQGLPVYTLLQDFTEQQAIDVVITANAFTWHEGCRFCSLDFDAAMERATLDAERAVRAKLGLWAGAW